MGEVLLIAIIVIAGYIIGKGCNKLKLPRVLGYLIAGVLLGTSVSKILQPAFLEKSDIIIDLTLGIVGFIIGNELRLSLYRKMGKEIITIIIMESLGAFVLVTIVVYFLTSRVDIALVLGAIAPASAPAGTLAVLHEYKAKGPLTKALQAVVGLDDGFGIMIFAFVISIVKVLCFSQEHVSFLTAVASPLIRIFGAIVLGVSLGIVLSYFAKKLRMKEELLIVSFAGILFCTGLCNYFHLSLILGNLALGMTVANTAIFTSRRISNVVEVITPPIYIIFFVLAGAHLNIGLLPKMGLIGIFYILSRTGGLMGGSYLGGVITRAPRTIKNYLGMGILSQAGVAIGLSLLISKEFGSFGGKGNELAILIINTIAATTIFFELIGPITTKIAIFKAGEVGKRRR
jgi:Kef-type K+ transport system membrane component KefB